jgi:hypothetical protein
LQVNLRPRALPERAADAGSSAGLPSQPVYLAEPEAGAFPRFFGCEERIEGFGQSFRVHALARVPHGDEDVVAGAQLRRKIARTRRDVPGCDHDLSPDWHRVTRVDAEVENGDFDLRRIDQSRPERRSEHCSQFNSVLADRAPEHLRHAADGGIQVNRLCGENLPAREGQKLLRELRAAPC